MNLITTAAGAALTAGLAVAAWPTLYGLGLVAENLIEVLARNDRLLWSAVWFVGSLFGAL